MSDLLESAELLAFTKIVDAQSVSRAARELRVPRATIGRRLQRLEERLGVRLLRRTTRSLVLTDAGESLYRHARLALDAVREAELSVKRSDDSVRGELRVSAPPITKPSFYAMLNAFLLAHPEVNLQIHFTTQHVDLKRAGYDVALRGSSQLEPGLVARMLGRTALVAVASPAYLARSGPLRTPRDLRNHHCLLGFAKGELPQLHWTDGQGRAIHVAGRLAANDIGFLCQAAIDGLGVAYLPLMQVREALASGALVRVLEGALEGDSRMAVVYIEREFQPAAVRAFVAAVVAWAKREGERVLWPEPLPREPAAKIRATKARATKATSTKNGRGRRRAPSV
jgi:DNA-binding transcriptional LysR family regulator